MSESRLAYIMSKQWESFLSLRMSNECSGFSLTSYYWRLILSFVQYAQPSHALIYKEVEFQWSRECQKGFDKLKEYLTRGSILADRISNKDSTLRQMLVSKVGAVCSHKSKMMVSYTQLPLLAEDFRQVNSIVLSLN